MLSESSLENKHGMVSLPCRTERNQVGEWSKSNQNEPLELTARVTRQGAGGEHEGGPVEVGIRQGV